MKRALALILAVMLSLCLAACQNEWQSNNATGQNITQENSTILVAYDSVQKPVTQAAQWVSESISGDLVEIGRESDLQADKHEFVLLGFLSQGDSIPDAVQEFLNQYDFGTRTIYLFVLDSTADTSAVTASSPLYSAISQLEPGALMGAVL